MDSLIKSAKFCLINFLPLTVVAGEGGCPTCRGGGCLFASIMWLERSLPQKYYSDIWYSNPNRIHVYNPREEEVEQQQQEPKEEEEEK